MLRNVDGVYSFAASGTDGLTFGVFKVLAGKLIGADHGGASYRGTVRVPTNSGSISVSGKIKVAMGSSHTQSISPQTIQFERDFSFEAPADFGDGTPFRARMASGYVTLMVKRISDTYGPLAYGMKVSVEPLPSKPNGQ